MELIRYEVRYYEDEEGGWNAEFPMLEGCLTCGDTREEVEERAVEALSGYLQTLSPHTLVSNYAEPGEDAETVMPDFRTALALTVRKMRSVANISQTEAAKRLGISQPSYARWEDPERCNITADKLEQIAAAFGRRIQISFPQAS